MPILQVPEQGKKISDLTRTTVFDQGDLILLQKSGEENNRAISQQDIVKSIGNPSVNGFTAVSTAANKITLTPANNGAEIDTYYDGMEISFISPITTDGIVNVDIGALGDKELKIIGTNDTAILSQGDYVKAIYVGDALSGKFYQTNLKVKSNQISDLSEVNSFNTGDFMSIHKSGAIDDNKISYNNLVKSLGNSSVFGFNATSTEANKIILTPANGGTTIDAYYEKMIVKFISPVTTSGATFIKIGSLPEKQLYKINTSDFSILSANAVVEAIYIGDKFYQTNIVEPVIFTNEYNVDSATINAQNTATTYILSSAIGVTNIPYYKGQPIAFTSPIDSKGAIYVNVNGLGLKPIVDPDGDPVPFNFYKNQRVMPVYDGVKFIKHILSDIEPEEPQPDPVIPPQDIVINVNPNDALQNIYDKVVKDYGENGGGRKVVLNLPSSFTNSASSLVNVSKNTPWITLKGNSTPVAQGFNFVNFSKNGNITISGTFITGNYWFIHGSNTSEVQSVTLKDCEIEVYANGFFTNPGYMNITLQNCIFKNYVQGGGVVSIIHYSNSVSGNELRGKLIVDNVEFQKYQLNFANSGNTVLKNVVIRSVTDIGDFSGLRQAIILQGGSYTINNLSTINCTFKPNQVGVTAAVLSVHNANVTIDSSSINLVTYMQTQYSILVQQGSRVTINSGDYRGSVSSEQYPDILVVGAGSILYRKSGVLGVGQAANGGIIQNI